MLAAASTLPLSSTYKKHFPRARCLLFIYHLSALKTPHIPRAQSRSALVTAKKIPEPALKFVISSSAQIPQLELAWHSSQSRRSLAGRFVGWCRRTGLMGGQCQFISYDIYCPYTPSTYSREDIILLITTYNAKEIKLTYQQHPPRSP